MADKQTLYFPCPSCVMRRLYGSPSHLFGGQPTRTSTPNETYHYRQNAGMRGDPYGGPWSP